MTNERPVTSSRETDPPGVSPIVFGLLLVSVVCLAGVLRFHRLDAQSFWNDEGNSARLAERSVDLIVEGAAGDIHPPGYYLLLRAWRAVFGQTEFALRSLSVVAGLVLVIFTGLVGRWLSGPVVGLMAASLSAISPFAIYYSQEARMYALLGALTAASIYIAYRILVRLEAGPPVGGRDGAAGWLLLWPVAYALVNAAGLYTHYAFLFVLIAHNVAFALPWVARWVRYGPRWHILAVWAGANLGVGLLYLPWLPTALGAAGWSSARGASELGSALLDVARVLAVGVTQSPVAAGLATAVTSGLMVAGAWPSTHHSGKRRLSEGWTTTSLVVTFAVPLGLFLAFDLYKPAWLKFLVILLPAYHVLVARGIEQVAVLVSRTWGLGASPARVARLVVCSTLVVASGILAYPSLRNLYLDPAYARDNYRGLAADIQAMRRPGDAIVLNAPNQWEVFTYYYPDEHVYPAPYRPDPEEASAFIGPLLDAYERVFVLYWGDAESDPKKRLESLLARRAYKAGDRWYGDVRLATYGVAPLPSEPDIALDARFGKRMHLQGYTLVRDRLTPGAIVPLTLFWEALDDIDVPYKVSVQMLDDQGQLVSQVDTVPGDGLAPTTSWRQGDVWVDRYGVSVPADASTARYRLIVAVYHAATGERTRVVVDGEARGDYLPLGEVSVRWEAP